MRACQRLARDGAPVLCILAVLTGELSQLQEALQQARTTLTSISADGLMASSGGAAPGLDPQSSYGSYGADGGYGAADALAVLGRMQSAGSLTGGDSHVLRSPGRSGQYMQHSSVQSAFGSAAAQQLHVIGSASRPLSTGNSCLRCLRRLLFKAAGLMASDSRMSVNGQHIASACRREDGQQGHEHEHGGHCVCPGSSAAAPAAAAAESQRCRARRGVHVEPALCGGLIASFEVGGLVIACWPHSERHAALQMQSWCFT